MGRFTTSLDGPEAAVAQLFDDGVVLDELLGVGVGELDRTAPAEEVLGRSDGGADQASLSVKSSESLLILLAVDELAVGVARRRRLALDELVGVGCDLAAYRERG